MTLTTTLTQAWAKVMAETKGNVQLALEAERAEMTLIREEKRMKEETNFLAFERMMLDGQKIRAEREAAAAAISNPLDPSPVKVNPFSGEKIIPTVDSSALRDYRHQRWTDADTNAAGHANDANAEGLGGKAEKKEMPEKESCTPPTSTTGTTFISAPAPLVPGTPILIPPTPPPSTSSTLSADRLKLLSDCAAVGSSSSSVGPLPPPPTTTTTTALKTPVSKDDDEEPNQILPPTPPTATTTNP